MTKTYYTIFNLIVLTVIIFSGVELFYKIVGSHMTQVNSGVSVKHQIHEIEQHKKTPLRNFSTITERNLLGSVEKASGEKIDDDLKGVEPTSLNLILLGTVSSDQQSAARAIIEEAGKNKQDLYKVGDSIENAVIDKILRKDVVLKVGDKYEKLTMKEPSSQDEPLAGQRGRRQSLRSSQRTSGQASTITVNREDMQASLRDINQLLTQVRIQPHFKDGNANGLAISRIKRGSIFSKLGMRNGDIIQQIDGNSLSSPEDIFGLYEKLRSGSQASLQISRRGRPKTLNYRFK
ncbi:MAG: PDZ domain-containing protein [Deltaproteobacteria bacterium]|nr:PDZ domain-containing protein [Deltaproteobacteria bacterium]